jgi:hypothetical protein
MCVSEFMHYWTIGKHHLLLQKPNRTLLGFREIFI